MLICGINLPGSASATPSPRGEPLWAAHSTRHPIPDAGSKKMYPPPHVQRTRWSIEHLFGMHLLSPRCLLDGQQLFKPTTNFQSVPMFHHIYCNPTKFEDIGVCHMMNICSGNKMAFSQKQPPFPKKAFPFCQLHKKGVFSMGAWATCEGCSRTPSGSCARSSSPSRPRAGRTASGSTTCSPSSRAATSGSLVEASTHPLQRGGRLP